MDVVIKPHKLKGVVEAMPSKSHAHRLLVARLLSELQGEMDKSASEIPSFSHDIAATKNCLAALKSGGAPVLDCGESGSTLRFLLPVAMAVCDEAVFTGSGKLPSRPVSPLKEEMESHGCHFADADDAMFKVSGRLESGDFTLPGNVSSQFVTGLLFALPILKGDSTLKITSPLESAGYVNLTLDVIRKFGINIKSHRNDYNLTTFVIPGGQKYNDPGNVAVEGDWSNSAFWLVCGALGGDVTCKGLNLQSAQPDKAILKLLKLAGVQIEISELGDGLASVRVAGNDVNSTRHSIGCDVAQMPDIVPPLAALLSGCEGTSTITGIERLRIKESDRVASVTDMLSNLGGSIDSYEHLIKIKGDSSLEGGIVNTFNDHRIAMAAAAASCLCENPVTVKDAQAVNKSYPNFFRDFASLGGEIQE